MSIQGQNIKNINPAYMYNGVQNIPVQKDHGSVVVTSQDSNTAKIYQYPTTSLYGEKGKDGQTGKAPAGVTIQIFNPSAIGGPVSSSVASAAYPAVQDSACNHPQTPAQPQVVASSPIASAEIKGDEKVNKKYEKTKNIVELTDAYIKTIENYLRSPSKDTRKIGITSLIDRYQEDASRHDDPALTALLNIALQDPDAGNRMAAMSPINAEFASGDENTVKLLERLHNSTAMYGEEAKMAKEASIKAVETKITVPVKE